MQKLIGFPPVRITLAILSVGIGLIVTQLIINLLSRLISADNPIAGIGDHPGNRGKCTVRIYSGGHIPRRYIQRITRDWLGLWWALGISSILFGLIHILSATATVQSVIAITLEAGVLLAAAYMLTNRLWLPIGVHVAWDFANDGIFGVGSSGATGETMRGLLQSKLTGPVFLSGGTAGVEASLVAVILVLAVSIYMIRIATRKAS